MSLKINFFFRGGGGPSDCLFFKGLGQISKFLPSALKTRGQSGGGAIGVAEKTSINEPAYFLRGKRKTRETREKSGLVHQARPPLLLDHSLHLAVCAPPYGSTRKAGLPLCCRLFQHPPPPSPSSRPFTSSVAGTPPPALPPQRTITLITLPVPLCSFFALKHHMCPSSFPYGIYPHARALRAALLVFPILVVKSRASEPPRRFSQRCARDQSLV